MASPEEWQVHSYIHCPYAIVLLSLTLRLLKGANFALECLASHLMPPPNHAVVVPNFKGAMTPTPSHASACPAITHNTVTTSPLKAFAMLPVERICLPPSLCTENLTPVATPQAALPATSMPSSTTDPGQKPSKLLTLIFAAPHLLPLVLLTLPAAAAVFKSSVTDCGQAE
jgi:hypothetical protein